jgi:hypothetical protein
MDFFVRDLVARNFDILEAAARMIRMTPSTGTPADITLVRFVQKRPPFNVGETAGFTPEDAEALVRDGLAEHAEAPSVPAPSSPETPARITFLAKYGPFNVGEVAGFPQSDAAQLVKHRLAVKCQ